MKKILPVLILSFATSASLASPLSVETAQQFIQQLESENYLKSRITTEANQEITEQIMHFYSIPDTKDNKKRIFTAIQNYYQSDAFKKQYEEKLIQNYQNNMTEEETQEWMQFYQTPMGKSILKNQAYEKGLINAIEQLFPENPEPSEKVQQKMIEFMQNQ